MANYIALALAGLLAASAAQAAEVTGGEAALEYSGFTGDNDDLNKFTARGSLEVSFSQQFAVQGDMSLSRMGLVDETGNSLGLHAIYNAPMFSLGAFVGKDWLDGGNASYYGVEAGTSAGLWRGEGYIGAVDSQGDNATMFGLRGDYAVMENVMVGGRFDMVDLDDADMKRLSLTTGLSTGNFELTGELGRARFSADGDRDTETFVGIGAKLNFGARKGSTFDQRGLLAILPGL